MIQIKTDKATILVVDVPEDVVNFTLINSHSYFKSPRIEHSQGGIDLSSGESINDWSILGTITKDEQLDFELKNIGIEICDEECEILKDGSIECIMNSGCQKAMTALRYLLESSGVCIKGKALILVNI